MIQVSPDIECWATSVNTSGPVKQDSVADRVFIVT